ncbi:MAG: hypothetical protein ABSE00_07920 [Chitinispirillaceae bacterium]|jgi:hypothetical protein
MGILPIGLIIAVIVLALLFLIFREALCWYWKINRMVRLLEIISGKFESLEKSLTFIAEKQSLSMTSVSGAPPLAEKEGDKGEAYEHWETGKLIDSLKSSEYDDMAKEQMREVLSGRYGIRFEGGKYRYRDYVSDDIAGAVECAQLYHQR